MKAGKIVSLCALVGFFALPAYAETPVPEEICAFSTGEVFSLYEGFENSQVLAFRNPLNPELVISVADNDKDGLFDDLDLAITRELTGDERNMGRLLYTMKAGEYTGKTLVQASPDVKGMYPHEAEALLERRDMVAGMYESLLPIVEQIMSNNRCLPPI